MIFDVEELVNLVRRYLQDMKYYSRKIEGEVKMHALFLPGP